MLTCHTSLLALPLRRAFPCTHQVVELDLAEQAEQEGGFLETLSWFRAITRKLSPLAGGR